MASPARRPAPAAIAVTGAGHATLTPTTGPDGTARVHIELTIVLPHDPHRAALRLTALTSHLTALIGPPRTTGRCG